MNAALNRHNWPFFEASAVTGMGVFETLKGISRFTLMSLKKRLGRSEPAPRPAAAGGAPKPAIPPAAAPATAPVPPTPPPAAQRPAAVPSPSGASPMSGSHPQIPQMPPLQPPAPAPAPPAVPRPAAAAPPAPPPGAPPRPAAPAVAAPPKAPPGATKGRTMDVLGELEKLRREAASGPAAAPPRPIQTGPRPTVAPAAPAPAAAGSNGRGELSRSIELTLRRADFQRAKRVLVSFQVEDDQHRVMDAVRDLAVDIKDATGLEKLLLRLNIALNAKE